MQAQFSSDSRAGKKNRVLARFFEIGDALLSLKTQRQLMEDKRAQATKSQPRLGT